MSCSPSLLSYEPFTFPSKVGREGPRSGTAPDVDTCEQVSKGFIEQVEVRDEENGGCSAFFIKSVFLVFSGDEEEDIKLLAVDDRRLRVVLVEDRLEGWRAGHGDDVDV